MRQLGCGHFSLSSRCKGNLWELSPDSQQGKCLSLSAEKIWLEYEEKEEKKNLPGSVSFFQPKQHGFSWLHLGQ